MKKFVLVLFLILTLMLSCAPAQAYEPDEPKYEVSYGLFQHIQTQKQTFGATTDLKKFTDKTQVGMTSLIASMAMSNTGGNADAVVSAVIMGLVWGAFLIYFVYLNLPKAVGSGSPEP